MMKRLIIKCPSLAVLMFVTAGWIFEASPARRVYDIYRIGDEKQKEVCIQQLSMMSDAGLPYLVRLLAKEKKNWSGRSALHVQLLFLDAIVRIGTDKAADVLADRARHGDGICLDALGRMGEKGLDRLLILSKDRVFVLSPGKGSLPGFVSSSARGAREAISKIEDRATIPALGRLVSDKMYADVALKALRRMKAPGYEDEALRIWNSEFGGSHAAALGYLLSVNRQAYISLLQIKLTKLDDSVVRLVFDLGGDPSANATLTRYITSRSWLQSSHQENTAAYAVLALGLSRTPDAKETLVPLLADATPLDATFRVNPPFSRYMLDGKGRGRGYGIPMFIIVAFALQEVGDPAVIPDLEKAADMQDRWFKPFFEEVCASLRSKNQVTHGEPKPDDDGLKPAP